MRQDRFEYLCKEVQSGNKAIISHPSSNEEGRVVSCSMDHLVVETDSGSRCWDFHECEEKTRS
jgi:hypothetical protein